jgi:hypothetical protein
MSGGSGSSSGFDRPTPSLAVPLCPPLSPPPPTPPPSPPPTPPPAPDASSGIFVWNVTNVTYEFNSAYVTKDLAAGNCSARGGFLVTYTSGAQQVGCSQGLE